MKRKTSLSEFPITLQIQAWPDGTNMLMVRWPANGAAMEFAAWCRMQREWRTFKGGGK